jgi:hypothetical protein
MDVSSAIDVTARGEMDAEPLLAVCLARLEWSPERLAREINKTCGPGTISSKAPYAWLRNSRPRGRVPQVVADLLSRRLSIAITPEQLWPRAHFGANIDRPADHGLTQPWTPQGMRDSAAALSSDWTVPDLQTRRSVTPPALIDHVTQWLVQPTGTIRERSAGEAITDAMLEALEARVSDLRRMDDAQGGNVVLDWAGYDLRWATQLLVRGAYDVDTGRRLHLIVAELAQLAGWLACDAGRHADAHRYWLLGLRAAHVAGDNALGANIVSCLSYQATWLDHGSDALQLIRIAITGARHLAAGRLVALLYSRQARALALVHDRSGADEALATAQEAHSSSDEAEEPSWTYWISPAVLAADAGRVWLDLGDPDRAEASLDAGLALFGEDQPRNRMLHNASLAEARLMQGEVHGAAEAAHHALDLAASLRSQRAAERFLRLRTGFTQVDAIAARELADRITSEVPHT